MALPIPLVLPVTTAVRGVCAIEGLLLGGFGAGQLQAFAQVRNALFTWPSCPGVLPGALQFAQSLLASEGRGAVEAAMEVSLEGVDVAEEHGCLGLAVDDLEPDAVRDGYRRGVIESAEDVGCRALVSLGRVSLGECDVRKAPLQ